MHITNEFSLAFIETQWKEDAKIDRTDLNASSANTLELHSKYFGYLNSAKRIKRVFEADKARMIILRSDYYTNQIAHEDLKANNWKPNQKIYMKSELDKILAADPYIIDLNQSIGESNDMIDFCDSIIKSIQQKAFVIKNMIEFKKFENGGF